MSGKGAIPMEMTGQDHCKKYFVVDGKLVVASFQQERSSEAFRRVRSILLGGAESPHIRQETGQSNKMGACAP